MGAILITILFSLGIYVGMDANISIKTKDLNMKICKQHKGIEMVQINRFSGNKYYCKDGAMFRGNTE